MKHFLTTSCEESREECTHASEHICAEEFDERFAPIRTVKAVLVTEDGYARRTEVVAVEMRVDLVVNATPWMMTACSPGDLEDYAYGAMFAAGLIERAQDVAGVDVRLAAGAAVIDVRLSAPLAAPLQPVGTIVPGCSLGAGRVVRPGSAAACAPLDPAAVWRMSRSLLPAQGMHLATGATHAAVFADRTGAPVLMREDVGRHNAVDKLVGALLRADIDPQNGFAYLSSRCALELVAKLARAGVRIVATVSAPTSAVLDFAERENVALAAFARDGRFTVYAHPELIAFQAASRATLWDVQSRTADVAGRREEATVDKGAGEGKPLHALERLREGNRRYVDAVHNDADISQLVREQAWSKGQHPYAIVVTCSDARVVPEHIFMAGIGELFSVRVAGNVVADTQLASVAYAAYNTGARLVLVLGHTQCGAVAAAMEGGVQGCVSAVTDLVRSAIGDEQDERGACALNVRASVDRLLCDPEITALVKDEGLEVVGGIYHLDTGRVELLDPATT